MSKQLATLPADTKILVVGFDASAAECLTRLIQAGAKDFTILDQKLLDEAALADNAWLKSATAGEPAAEGIASWLKSQSKDLAVATRIDNPLEVISKNPDWILSFSFIFSLSVERDVELALGNIIFEAPSKALIISRCDEFHGKWRSLYGTYTDKSVSGAPTLKGVRLEDRPGPPLPEKCERVRKAFAAAIDLSSPEIISYLLVVYATGAVFQKKQGYPAAHRPAAVSLTGHEAEVEALIRDVIAEKDLKQATVDTEAIKICCAEGWGGLPLTPYCMGATMAGEAITLLTATGQVCDAVPMNLAAQAALGIPIIM